MKGALHTLHTRYTHCTRTVHTQLTTHTDQHGAAEIATAPRSEVSGSLMGDFLGQPRVDRGSTEGQPPMFDRPKSCHVEGGRTFVFSALPDARIFQAAERIAPVPILLHDNATTMEPQTPLQPSVIAPALP